MCLIRLIGRNRSYPFYLPNAELGKHTTKAVAPLLKLLQNLRVVFIL